jgi:hypothetical protein
MQMTKEQERTMVAAQTAYEAYCNYTGWKSLATGCDLPKWSDLPGNIKNAWFAALSAVCDNEKARQGGTAHHLKPRTSNL